MDFYEYNDLVQQWVQNVLDNRGKNAELTLKFTGDIIDYGQKSEDHKLLGFGYYYMGETYYGLNDGNNFFATMSKALPHLNEAEDWELVARCYNYLGIAAMNRGNVPIALDYYLNGLRYCRSQNMPELAVVCQINIGVLNMSCGRYAEAQNYLEKSASFMKASPDNENYHSYMLCIYTNLIKSLVMQNKERQVPALLETIYTRHWEYSVSLDRMAVHCAEAFYYHRIGDEKKRDLSIEKVEELLPENLSILDMFDDFYDYCIVLLEAGKDKAFWHVIAILEPLIKSFNIINLHLKIISLKMKYYRKHDQNAEYLQAAGLYYELSEVMETETKQMMNTVLSLRSNLEWMNRERRKTEARNRILQEKSELDQLTKLANRFRLNDYSEEVFTHACENQLPLAVEILDIDYFKEFNDNYGHQAGDNCLKKIAGVIQALAQENGGFCARYGGDEFVLLYEGRTREQMVSLAGELKRRVMALELEHKFSKALPIVTISQGICCEVPQEGNRMGDFLHAADDMLYKIKKLSRNNYCVGDLKETEGELVVGQ